MLVAQHEAQHLELVLALCEVARELLEGAELHRHLRRRAHPRYPKVWPHGVPLGVCRLDLEGGARAHSQNSEFLYGGRVERKGEPQLVSVDEHPRKETSLEAISCLRPSFKKEGGTVTAANSSGINDGAATLLIAEEAFVEEQKLQPLGWIRSFSNVGLDPQFMGMGPANAIEDLLQHTELKLADIDLLEVNEAFAAQALAVGKKLSWDEARVNVNGGAIALGHPLGASGARVAVTLLHEMRKQQAARGIASLCIGGGMGIAMLFESA